MYNEYSHLHIQQSTYLLAFQKTYDGYINWIKVVLKRSLETDLKVTFPMNWPQSQLLFFFKLSEVRINEIYWLLFKSTIIEFSFSKLWSMQNSLESSVKSTPVSSCSFRTLRHFTATAKGQCYALKPLWNPH